MKRRRFLSRKRLTIISIILGTGLILTWDMIAPWPSEGETAVGTVQSLENFLPTLPERNIGRSQRPGDAWNLLFIGTEQQVTSALQEAGWIPIALRIPTGLREGLAELFQGKMLTKFPTMSLYQLYGRYQDQNWAQIITPIQTRHHFRLWKLPYQDPQGRPIWWGSADFDLKVRWRDLTHVPDPDMNAERDYIGDSLKNSRWVEALRHQEVRHIPRQGTNDAGYPFIHDGRVLIVTLNNPS